MFSSLPLFSLYLISGVYGSIGPTANVFIQNKIIGPDGFNRSYVVLLRVCRVISLKKNVSTVLAGGVQNRPTFPGPLIKGNKVAYSAKFPLGY